MKKVFVYIILGFALLLLNSVYSDNLSFVSSAKTNHKVSTNISKSEIGWNHDIIRYENSITSYTHNEIPSLKKVKSNFYISSKRYEIALKHSFKHFKLVFENLLINTTTNLILFPFHCFW